MRDLTLRQVEVVRAVMLTGTINGAATLLGVSAPGISRLVKHTEESLGLRLFERKGGLFVPSVEASAIFDQIGRVYKNVENLSLAIASLQRGEDARLSFASAPSIAQFVAARAIRRIRKRWPDLYIENEAIATGQLVAVVPDDHPLAQRSSVSVHDLVREEVIGIDPDDPYGAILMQPFTNAGLTLTHAMRGRFAQTVISLVRHGLGVALIDEFSVAEVYMPGLTRLPLDEPSAITAYACWKKGRVLSGFAERAIDDLRHELNRAVTLREWQRRPEAD